MTDEEENIDKSCWLPPDEPILPLDAQGNPWRAQHDGMTLERGDNGEIRFAQVQIRNGMNWLWERDVLTDQHLHDGQTYERWEMIYRALRTKGPRPHHLGGIGGGEMRCSEYGYTLLLLRLPALHHRNIQLTFEPTNEHRQWLMWRNRLHYRRSFQALTDVMPAVICRLDEMKKSA